MTRFKLIYLGNPYEFVLKDYSTNRTYGVFEGKLDNPMDEVVALLNKQAEEISYWKHKVSSLLWILGQFDKEKVKELMEELEKDDGDE